MAKIKWTKGIVLKFYNGRDGINWNQTESLLLQCLFKLIYFDLVVQ